MFELLKFIILHLSDNGRIDFQEFYNFMQAEMSKFQDDEFMHQEDVIRSAFKTFDKDGNGFIDAKELRYNKTGIFVIPHRMGLWM